MCSLLLKLLLITKNCCLCPDPTGDLTSLPVPLLDFGEGRGKQGNGKGEKEWDLTKFGGKLTPLPLITRHRASTIVR